MVRRFFFHNESVNHLSSTGIYTVLSMIWVYIILRQRQKIHWIFRVLGLIMYMVASADIGFTVWLLFQKTLKGESLCQYVTPRYLLYVTNKYVFLHAYYEVIPYPFLSKYIGRYSIALSMLRRLESR